MIPNWARKNIYTLPKRRRPPSRWERRSLKAMRALAVLCLVGFVIWRTNLHFQITRQFNAIRAAGLPTSPQELDRWYAAVPEGSNAAPLMKGAVDLLRTFPDSRSKKISDPKLLARREKWSDEIAVQIAEYVAMNREALEKAGEGVQRPQCRYPADFSYGLQTDLSHLSGLKSLARAAALRASLSVRDGQPEHWPADVGLMLQLAGTLNQEPALLSHLVRGAIVSMAVKTTERCLNTTAPSEGACSLI